MRVLVLVDSLALGGAERLLATLAPAAPAAGFTFEVAVLAGTSDPRSEMWPLLRDAGVPVRFLGVRRLASPAAVPRVASAVRRSRPDLVHAHLEYSATLGPPAARLAGKPALCTFHHVPGPLPPREAIKERLAVEVASRSRAVIFVSEASRRGFAARYGARRSWRMVHNGVDLAVFRPGPAVLPADLGVRPGAPAVAFVGALRPAKGQAAAIEAWRHVVRVVPEARLLLVGSGPEEGRLRTAAAAAEVSGRVLFCGARPDVPALLRGAALVVLPSETEALPTTLLEAAACGRAVVATDVGGVREVVVDGETGIVVPPGDTDAFGRAVVTLLRDEACRTRMGTTARAVAELRFDARTWARNLGAVYADAVGHR